MTRFLAGSGRRKILSWPPPAIGFPFPALPAPLAALLLLGFDRQRGINDRQPKLRDHFFVFVQDPSLKNAKTLVRIVAQAEIQPGLVKLEAGASS